MKKYFPIGIAVALSAFLLLNCSKSSNSGSSGGTNPPPDPNSITIANMSFGTASLTVKAGTTITWTNQDALSHTVTADDNSFTSPDMPKGATYSHTFAATGTYNYHCKYHSMMVATIIVN